MTRWRRCLGMLAAAALTAAAAAMVTPGRSWAQTAAPAAEEATLVSELVVNARLPGPPWWRVSDGDSTVYVLGVPGAADKKLKWDDSVLRRRLDGAEVLILPPEPKLNMLGLVGFIIRAKKTFTTKEPLSETVPPATYARLQRALATSGDADDDDFDRVKPAFAGFLIANKQAGDDKGVSLSFGEVTDHVRDVARGKALAKKPRIRSLGSYDVLGLLQDIGRLPPAGQVACLEDGLTEFERGDGGALRLAQRWAAGDVRAVVAAKPGFERCLLSVPAASAINGRGAAAMEAAILDALERPGKSVAVVELYPLLRVDGVLDRLRGRGLTVATPAE